MPQTQASVSQDTDANAQFELHSFSHLVQQGWSAECVERNRETSDLRSDLVLEHSDDCSGLHAGQGPHGFGNFTNLREQGHEQLVSELGFGTDSALDGLDEGFLDSGLNSSPLHSFDDRQDLRSQMSSMDEDDLDRGTEVGSIVSNISACVDAAFAMLPLEPPKPVWEQGVWADIFGEGVFLKSQWNATRLSKTAYHAMSSAPDSEPQPATKRARLKQVSDDIHTYSDIVVHKSDVSWQEERESTMQNALKRWLVTSSYFNPHTLIRVQLDSALQEIDKLTLLADVFGGRAPATLLKRVRSVEKMCSHFGMGFFPPDEKMLYAFFSDQRSVGAPPSKLKGFMEALSFCRFVLSMEELAEVTNSRRCAGATRNDVPSPVTQAVALTVDELKKLHAKLQDGEIWDRIFCGSILFAVYSRARWADLMHCDQVLLDKDEHGTVRFVEGHTATHKTMRAAVFKHQFLCLTAPAFGVTSDCWPQTWVESRHMAGVMLPPFHCVMPAPDKDGFPTKRPLSSSEASQWLRKVLTGNKIVSAARKISTHSCKATCLSYCAKYGVDPMTRPQLGYHSGGGSGLRMVHTYSRDAASEPLAKLVQVLDDIRTFKFKPDNTRSGRFDHTVVNTQSMGSHSMPQGRVSSAVPKPAEFVDLVSEKEEEESDSGEDVTSSSGQSSAEDFQEGQRQLKIFLPPRPPPGYVFWQHTKLKTLHLAPPDYTRYFMCNRPVGKCHSRDAMVIRYDTPICRQCAHATKDD